MSGLKKSQKNTSVSRAVAHVRLMVVGMALTGACGGLMLTENAFTASGNSGELKASADHVSPMALETVTDAEDENIADSAKEAIKVFDTKLNKPFKLPEHVEQLSFVRFKKAPIGEYDMTAIETKVIKLEGGSGEILDPNDFTVPFPKQETLVYEPVRQPPMNLAQTRSVADEYFRVYDENSGSTVVMSAHELLCLMVNNEIGDTWDEDAIKAQTVAAYSHLRYNDEHGFTPTVGLKYGYSGRLENCVSSVEGQAMYYDGSIINAVYSASTAGYSTTGSDIWGVDLPYLKCVKSEYDHLDPNWGKVKTFTREEIKSRLESKFGITLSDDVTKWFTIERAYSIRYIDRIIVDGRSDCVLSGVDLCYLADHDSNAMEIKYKDGIFTFTSYGWGHGAGMSQWGAHYYAENGWTYDQILMHYYVDAKLRLSTPSESTVKPVETADDSQDGETVQNTEGEPPYTPEHSDTDGTAEPDYTESEPWWTGEEWAEPDHSENGEVEPPYSEDW